MSSADYQPEPAFDPRWLDLLCDALASCRSAGSHPEDLYLERRLELEVEMDRGAELVHESRSEGAALRWRYPDRWVLRAQNGVSPQTLAELLSHAPGSVSLPAARPAPPADIDPPRGWLEWARELVAQLGNDSRAAFLCRQAVILRPGRWQLISSPPLLRIRRGGDEPGALLAVWKHPRLAAWLRELVETPPPRPWQPTSGLRPPVLLTAGSSGVLLHELVGHLAEIDVAACAASPLARMMGATITAGSIEVSDDPTRSDLPGAFSCDDEGVEAAAQPLVESGRLVGWLCDRAGAERFGGAPGRGRRAGWNLPPAPRLSNLVVESGSSSPEEMERDLRHGLVVTRISAATVDPVSARCVIRVERGWEVRNGRRRRALARCELTGPALEVLAHIDPTLGSDRVPEWRAGWCMKAGTPLPTGSEAPTMLVHRLEVL